MPKVPYLDAATEQQLQRALTKVSDHVATGDSATAAIVKVARDTNLSRGQTELLVRAYNTGRTLYQFDTAKTLEEKLADFPLADAGEALTELFPERIKTAAEVQQDSEISQDYSVSPQGWLSRLDKLENAEKHAAVLVAARRERQPQKTARLNQDLTEYNAMLAATRDADLANQAEQAAAYAAQDSLAKLAEYFRGATALPLTSVRMNAAMVYGARADAVFDAIAEDNPQLTKQAGRMHAVDWSRAPYSLLQDCFRKAADYLVARQTNDSMKQSLKEAREVLYGPFANPLVQTTSGSIWDSASSEVKSAAANPALWAGVGGGMFGAMKDLASTAMPNKETIVKGHMARLQDPSHEQELRKIRTQSLLSDLMLHDPVISGYGQDEVLDAYTRLSEVAPAAVQHKLLAQALMRKYLEQGNQLEPFDMDQLIGIENKLKPAAPAAPALPK